MKAKQKITDTNIFRTLARQFSSIKSKSSIVVVAICTFLCYWTAFYYDGGVFMKKIHLGGKHGSAIGNYALVDDEDYDWLNQWKWCLKGGRNGRNGSYAHRGVVTESGKWTTIPMHRLILGITDPKICVDHIDQNGLNNQRHNLRGCSTSQNRMNSRPNSNTSSIYKGVTYRASGIGDRWIAQIRHKKKTTRIGTFGTQEEAAMAYNRVAEQMFGGFAKPNEI